VARPVAAGDSEAAALIRIAHQESGMPATLEVVCTDDSCELDMFEMAFTYDMPDDVTATDFSCPYCDGVDCLEEVEL
jgi:hypothetical protein